jgi:hypothetical protein
MGVDSTAMLVGLAHRGVRPDLILFADTGGERPETYAYLPIIQAWLRRVGFPPVQVVRYSLVKPRADGQTYSTLEESCLVNQTLPSLAMGKKSCSLKWKRGPQDKFVDNWQRAVDCWMAGGQVTKAIGYDSGAADSKRAWNLTDDRKYHYWYPLRDWGWNREECKRQIAAEGLPVPPKSACFFCPASKPWEISEIVDLHPDLADRIIAIEAAAKPKLDERRALGLPTTEGLWRKSVAGMRGATPHPGAMTPYIEERRKKSLHLNVVDEDSEPTLSSLYRWENTR